MRGRQIRTLVEQTPQASGRLTWDGKGEDGKRVRAGIYIVFAESVGSQHFTHKTTVVVAKSRE